MILDDMEGLSGSATFRSSIDLAFNSLKDLSDKKINLDDVASAFAFAMAIIASSHDGSKIDAFNTLLSLVSLSAESYDEVRLKDMASTIIDLA